MNVNLIKKSLVLQHNASDCGVACLLSLIRYYGGVTSMENLRELSGTSKQGTTLLGLYQAAIKLGLDAEGCEANVTSLIEHGQPVILHTLIDKRFEHYVVCYGYENGKFLISDPAKGIVFLNEVELELIWVSHACLKVSLTNSFERKNSIEKKKKKWLIDLLREDFPLLGISVALGLLISILGMTTAIFSQKLIDYIIPEKDYTRLWFGIIILSFLLFARLGLSALRQLLLYTQGRDFNNRIIVFFYNKLLRLPKSFFDSRKVGELVARLNDTRRIQSVIGALVGNFIIDVLILVVTIGFMLHYSWLIGSLIIFSIPLYVLIIYRYNDILVRSQKNVMIGYANSESNFISTMQGIDTIKNFNKQSVFEKLNQSVYSLFQTKVFELGKINIKLSFLFGLISLIIVISTIGVGSYLVLNSFIKLGEFIAILTLVSAIISPIVNLALFPISINEAKVAFNRMFEFVNIIPENNDGNSMLTNIEDLKIDSISYRFAGRKRILNNISFCANKNEMIFIIGESGCGKTTFCRILEKFYEPESGRIIINGNQLLNDISVDKWRELVGVIPQEIFIFNGTVLDNICLGNSPEDLQNALEICSNFGFDKYFFRMPQGYFTNVGEEGINLSGGQKQLIALARILVKNPQILVLDEPTSAMDRETERFALDLLSSVKSEKVIFIVSHRLHILKKYADKICLFEDGIVKCSETHQELLLTENFYSLYWNELI